MEKSETLVLFLLLSIGVTQANGDCSQNVNYYGPGWDTGRNGELTLTFPETANAWSIDVEFDRDVTGFDVWNGNGEALSDRKYRITNKEWNGNVLAGQSMTLGFQVKFGPGLGTPNIVSISVGDAAICGMNHGVINCRKNTGNVISFFLVEDNSEETGPPSTNTACSQSIEFYGEGWNTGRNGKLTLSFPETVDSWKVIVETDRDLTDLVFWSGIETRLSARKYEISNKHWNGNVMAGTTVELGFQMKFQEQPGPEITSVTFEGATCGRN